MLRLVNFAHGAFYAIGAYVGLIVAQQYGLIAGLIAAPLAVALFAVVFDRVLLRLFYDKEPTAQILVTFGVAIVVEESLRVIFGGTTRQFPLPDALSGSFNLGFATYPTYRLLLAAGIVVLIVAVWAFIERTDYGLIVRAGIRDRTMVQLLGGQRASRLDHHLRARCGPRGARRCGRESDLQRRPEYGLFVSRARRSSSW